VENVPQQIYADYSNYRQQHVPADQSVPQQQTETAVEPAAVIEASVEITAEIAANVEIVESTKTAEVEIPQQNGNVVEEVSEPVAAVEAEPTPVENTE
jgi:hypothetical protein